MNANDWVAEHVMGFKQGHCQGITGGGNASSDGTCESWFYCDWCGQRVDYGKAQLCAYYPSPKFALVDLAEELGKKGHYVMLRYDPLRSKHNFTLTLDKTRIADTDHPLQALCDYLCSNHDRLFPEPQEEAEPMFFANIRDAIKLLQKTVGQ